MPYPWYELIEPNETLEQGDILRNCLDPVLPRLASSEETPDVKVEEQKPEESGIYDRVVVLSQSCDLADGRIQRVMVCPVYTFAEYLKTAGGNKQSVFADLKKGRRIAYHLLNLCEIKGYEAPHLVADFGDAFGIPFAYAKELSGNHRRVRLLPPYREHLAQMFARFYMRVGLPIEVASVP
jgi:hypothetical protein